MKLVGGVLSAFGVMLLVTAVVVWALVTTGIAASVIAPLGLAVYLPLLVLQVLFWYGASTFRTAYPLNLAFAIGFAAFEGVFLAPIVGGYLAADLGIVLAEALGITATVFVALAAIPLLTGRRFGRLGGVLFAGLLVALGVAVLRATVGLPGTVDLAASALSLTVFGLFVLYDVSTVLEDERGAVAGAIALYLDFALLFLEVLRVLDRR